MLTLEELRADESIDTIALGFTDMQGRLLGKRLHRDFFLDGGHEHGTEGCNYLLALEMEMDPVPGYEIASWEQGYGDFVLKPDLASLRRIPWLEGTALVLCDVLWHDGSPVAPSPRQVLRRQVERAAELGFTARFGSELEFFLFRESFAEARAKHFRELTPSVPYILDYHLLATSYDEPFLRAIRNAMVGAGIPVESSKGEAWPGQHEINFRYADAVAMADSHVVYKTGLKEMAHQHGLSVTFMAKPDHAWVGSSCHVHGSLWRGEEAVFASDERVFRQFLAGWIACARELALFFAPNVNSYKRFAAGSWAPTTLAWGHDNRTCGFRIVGHGAGLRVETRIPGADVNPYLCFAALLAAGLWGIEHGLEPPPAFEGNAYESQVQRFPSTLREAIAALEEGEMARSVFGDQVVDHYLNYARHEQALFDRTVTCYERERLFERG